MSGAGPPLHPAVAGLAFLLGDWHGSGAGGYPTVDDFRYEEELRFGHFGKPFLTYVQRTRSPDGTPMHVETGFWRLASGRVELVVAHPTGHVEVSVGTLEGTTVRLRSASVAATPSAKPVQSLAREITVTGDRLEYRLEMEAVGLPLQLHVAGRLERAG